MKLDIISLDNQKMGEIDLDPSVFAVASRPDIVARMVNWQLAKRRAGTQKTKTRAEISGTGHKPFKQKGTGRARQGTLRGPQMRGGGKAMGPSPRSHAHKLPKKVRALALKTALSAKCADGKLVVIDTLKVKTAKTADLVKCLSKLGWTSTLVIDGPEVDANFARAAANVIGIDVLPSQGANVYDILRRDVLALTKDAVEKLVERLK